MMRAYFVKVHPDAILPVYKTQNSVACDICALEDTVLEPARTTKVRTGLVAIPPVGFYWEIYARSSLGMKYPGVMLSNNVGIIDSDFRGPKDEICVLIYNPGPSYPSLTKGERIAQLVLREMNKPKVIEMTVETLEDSESRGGFGSTGKF